MADVADIADIFQENHLAATLHKARVSSPVLVATGSCHSCGEPVAESHRFCDEYCLQDWERVQSANARAGRPQSAEVSMG